MMIKKEVIIQIFWNLFVVLAGGVHGGVWLEFSRCVPLLRTRRQNQISWELYAYTSP
jgi:hypothetical protein